MGITEEEILFYPRPIESSPGFGRDSRGAPRDGRISNLCHYGRSLLCHYESGRILELCHYQRNRLGMAPGVDSGRASRSRFGQSRPELCHYGRSLDSAEFSGLCHYGSHYGRSSNSAEFPGVQ